MPAPQISVPVSGPLQDELEFLAKKKATEAPKQEMTPVSSGWTSSDDTGVISDCPGNEGIVTNTR